MSLLMIQLEVFFQCCISSGPISPTPTPPSANPLGSLLYNVPRVMLSQSKFLHEVCLLLVEHDWLCHITSESIADTGTECRGHACLFEILRGVKRMGRIGAIWG